MPRFVLLLALVVSAACASHTAPPPRPQPDPTQTVAAWTPPQCPCAESAGFAVVAIDARSGRPLDGARLDVEWTETDDDGRTNADGYAYLAGAPLHAPFIVEVSAPGFDTWTTSVTLAGDTQIDARLTRSTGGFAIVAQDARSRRPIPGARLDVQWTLTEDDGRTNNDGYAYVEGAPLDVDVVVQVAADGYRSWETVARLTTDTQIDVPLTPLGEAVIGEPPWPGRLAIGPGARCFVNGEGRCELPVLAHFGEAFSKYTRNPDLVRAQLREVKRAGYDGIRFWDTLGYYQMAWQGRELMPWAFRVCTDSRYRECTGRELPATIDYYAVLEAFLTDLRDIGLTAHHSRGDLNGQSASRVVGHAEQVARIYDRVGWQVLGLAEGNNEDWQNGDFRPDGLRRIVAPFKARGALTALSAPPNSSEEPAAIRDYAADVFYVHGSRGGSFVDIIRHIFSLAREQGAGVPRLGWQGEPAGPGPGVTVGQVNDPEALALMAAESLMSRQAWVYMSSHGVFYDGPLLVPELESPLAYLDTAPLDTHQPGFVAVPRMARAIEAFAPDVMSWRLTHRSASDAALTSDKPRENQARLDQAVGPDGRIVAVLYDASGGQGVRNATGRAVTIDILGVARDEQLTRETVTLGPGQTLPVAYRVGRVLLVTPVGGVH